VAAGCAYLDQLLPDWRKYVDDSTLDVSSADACVLAQVGYHPQMRARIDEDNRSGVYWQVLDLLKMDNARAQELGFNYYPAGYSIPLGEEKGKEVAAGQNMLTLEWRTLLGRR
jgi:hypothetical protein